MILVLLTVFRFLKFCAAALRRIRQVLRTCNCGLRPLKDCAFGAVDDFRSEELRLKIYPQSGANGDTVGKGQAASIVVGLPASSAVVVDN